jgi:outer membrane protein TolC
MNTRSLTTRTLPQSRLVRTPLAVSLAAVFLMLAGCATPIQPIEMAERSNGLSAERSALTEGQAPITEAVSMDEAMARALKYNLDYRLKQMEDVLAQRQLDLSRADLLPRLSLAAGYSDRNNDNASFSRNIATGLQSLAPSTSQDRSHSNVDLALTWNVLDFGVSYYQSQQQADRVLVAQERKRKTVHLVMQQVRQAYWQAMSAQQLQSKIGTVLEEARKALLDSKKIEQEKLAAPLDILSYQRQLLDIIRQLEAINDELAQAKPRLAALMNLEPGKPFQLVVPGKMAVPSFKLSMEKMEETALLRRPELMEARYNDRISLIETRKAMARLYPGLELSIGQHHDSNSYLTNANWRDAGLRISWNLMNLLNASTIRDTAQAQQALAKQQRLALSMTVLTQTHVAWRDFTGKVRQYELSDEINSVDQRILGHTRNATLAQTLGKLQEVRANVNALMSELRLHQSYGSMQAAYGQILSTLGLDPIPSSIDSHDLPALRSAVSTMEARWAAEVGQNK